MEVGAFACDYRDGEISFSHGVIIKGANLTKKQISSLVKVMITTVDRVISGLALH